MPPQVISMKDIRRIMPSYDGIQRALAAHPGCHFGLVTKIGAQPKTRTLTTLYQTMHAKTKRYKWQRHDIQFHDEFEETVPTDLVFLRSVGIISLKKRHAFSHFFARREGSEDPARRVAIAAQEAARLASLQNAQLERQLAFARAKADAESGLTEEELRAERREEEGDESVTIEELMAEKRQEERLEGLDAELAERRKKLEERKDNLARRRGMLSKLEQQLAAEQMLSLEQQVVATKLDA